MRRVNPWRPLSAVCIVGLAIFVGLVVGSATSAGRYDTGIYQFVCLYYDYCSQQYAYVHAERDVAPVLVSVTISVTVAYTVLWTLARRTVSFPDGCNPLREDDFDIREAIRDGMVKLPYSQESQEYPLFALGPPAELAPQVARARLYRAKSAALLLAVGHRYSPCDFLQACELLKREFGDNFRHLFVASSDLASNSFVAVSPLDAGYALALREGHFYTVKAFLELLADNTNLDSALAARQFAVVRGKIDGSLRELLVTLHNAEGTQFLVCANSDKVIGMISFARIVKLLLRHYTA